MEQLPVQVNSESDSEVLKFTEGFSNLKNILTWSKSNFNKNVIIVVPPSRYLKILSDYWALGAIMIDGGLDKYLEYRFYYLTDLDNNGNAFKIVKKKEEEYKGKCEGCNCSIKKWMNPKSNKCYYKEMIENDYYTPKNKLK